MFADSVSRRAFLAAAGAAGAAWLTVSPDVLEATLVRARERAQQAGAPKFKSLTADQAADLEAVAMRIFPSDGSPGAKEAGVLHFFDEALAGFAAGQKAPLFSGLEAFNKQVTAKWPGARSFSALTPAQQDEMLKASENTPFFGQVRFMTIVGMFGNPSYGGNKNDTGWKLIGHQAHGLYQPPFGFYDAEVRKGG